MSIQPVDDLRWLYQECECEMGISSSMGPQLEALQLGFCSARGIPSTDEYAALLMPGWVSAAVPTNRQLTAVQRDGWVRDALRKLSPHDQSILEAAYELRASFVEPSGRKHQPVQDVGVHGTAALIACRMLRERGKVSDKEKERVIAESGLRLRAAQDRYVAAARECKHERRAANSEHRDNVSRRCQQILRDLMPERPDPEIRARALAMIESARAEREAA